MVRLAGMALVWPEGVGMDRLLFGVAVPVQRRGPAEVVLNFVRMGGWFSQETGWSSSFALID